MNLDDLWAIARRRRPETVAVAYREDGGDASLTFRALHAAADRLAAALAARGVGRGERVALHLGNHPRTAVAYLAALRAGAVAVPVNLAYRRPEIAHLLADAEPRLALAAPGAHEDLEAAAAQTGVEVAAVDDLLSAAPSAPGASPSPPPAGSDLALLLYTSGTTGRSKGAMLSHDNLLSTVVGLYAAWGWREDDRLLLALPLFHTHGLVVGLFTALAAGATVELHRRFDAAAVADAVTGERDDLPSPTLFFGVPTMYVRLADELARRRRAGLPHAAAGMRLFASGSAPLAAETFALFRDLTGHEILERYGMTETGMNLSNPYAGARRPGTVGVPLPGVSARVVGEDGEELPDGGEGELLVSGGNVFSGYWRAPEKTAESFLSGPDGRRWLRTGDLARRDPESGYYTLLGRRTELILSGGYNVYPREVEEAILTWPGVREAAVAGLPDRDLGELVAAWLVVDGDLDEAALGEHLAARLARYKLPRRYAVVESLPRNALGKVQKKLLPR